MPSNPAISIPTHTERFRIAGWEVLDVAGSDAAAFLQRQTMNDISLLTDAGHAQWNGVLNAKGRVQAMFICLRADAERYWLITPDLPANALKELLQRFVFRSKLRLTLRADLLAFGEWKTTTSAQSWLAMATEMRAEVGANIEIPGATGARVLHLAACAEAVDQAIDSDANARWRLDDLRCGLPRLSAEQMDAWTPHMLGLERLAAFSLKKGCYPGQEIVARTHYLGRSKRSLLRLDADVPIDLGVSVLDAGGAAIGNTICNASWHGHHTALVVAATSLQKTPLQTDTGFLLHPNDFAVR